MTTRLPHPAVRLASPVSPCMACLLALCLPAPAGAHPQFLRMFKRKYPQAQEIVLDCALCHKNPNGGGDRNGYGKAFGELGMAPTAFTKLEPLDSDGDGVKNIDEIRADRNPGDKLDKPGEDEKKPEEPTTTTTPPGAQPPDLGLPPLAPQKRQRWQPKLVPLSEEDIDGAGDSPGVTFADDVYPIFRRNKCTTCHSGPAPTTAPGAEGYALSLDSPRLAYLELTYDPTAPLRPGETETNGASYWPLNARRTDQKRRVDPGDAENSSLFRKLAGDYVGVRAGLRVKDSLKLQWGPPMPPASSHGIDGKDLSIIKTWIDGLMRLHLRGTAIKVNVVTADGDPVPEAKVVFHGDWDGQSLRDRFGVSCLYTDEHGATQVVFDAGSIISRQWYLVVTSSAGSATGKVTLERPGQSRIVRLVVQ